MRDAAMPGMWCLERPRNHVHRADWPGVPLHELRNGVLADGGIRLMGATILYCSWCASAYGSLGEVPARCPSCDRVTHWSTEPLPPAADQPKVPYVLTWNDRRLLKSLRIQVDEQNTEAEKKISN